MASEFIAGPTARTPTPTGTTLRRSIIVGWLFLVVGFVWTFILALVFVFAAPTFLVVLVAVAVPP